MYLCVYEHTSMVKYCGYKYEGIVMICVRANSLHDKFYICMDVYM
jgi:hypothetical protein